MGNSMELALVVCASCRELAMLMRAATCCSHIGSSASLQLRFTNKMSKWEPKPFAVRHTIVIEGGWLQSPWAVNAKEIDGRDFITLVMGDRCLARALGMNMSDRSPLAKCSIFAHIADIRDAKVDELLFAAKANKDPMADATSSDQAASCRMPSRGRATAFEQAAIPGTIEIKVGGFVTPEGQRVEEHTLHVVTTPKRGASVTMEITAENFEWLLAAAQVDWDTAVKPDKRSDELDESTLPHLEQPLKYQKTQNGKLQICCNYRKQGVWRKHQKVVNVSINSDNSSLEAIVRTCESEVMMFYSSNHEKMSHDDEQVSPPPLTM